MCVCFTCMSVYPVCAVPSKAVRRLMFPGELELKSKLRIKTWGLQKSNQGLLNHWAIFPAPEFSISKTVNWSWQQKNTVWPTNYAHGLLQGAELEVCWRKPDQLGSVNAETASKDKCHNRSGGLRGRNRNQSWEGKLLRFPWFTNNPSIQTLGGQWATGIESHPMSTENINRGLFSFQKPKTHSLFSPDILPTPLQ